MLVRNTRLIRVLVRVKIKNKRGVRFGAGSRNRAKIRLMDITTVAMFIDEHHSV